MTIEEWQALYDSLEITSTDGLPYAKLPNEKVLDDFEIKYGIKLPIAYREFIQVFGPGDLGDEFHIYAPGFSSDETLKEIADLGRFYDLTTPLKPSQVFINYHKGYTEQIARMFFFAASSGGEIIGWDLHDVRDEKTYEYAIYILLRDRPNPELFANSFIEFIDYDCFGDGYFRFFTDEDHWDEEERGSQRVFWPAANY